MGSFRAPLVALLVLGSVWLGAVPVQACPGCRTQGEMVELGEPETVTASLAMSWSVLFLLVVLGGVGGFLGVYIRNTVIRVDAANSRK